MEYDIDFEEDYGDMDESQKREVHNYERGMDEDYIPSWIESDDIKEWKLDRDGYSTEEDDDENPIRDMNDR